MAKIKVSGELEVATAEGKLADAAQVVDSTQNKTQEEINAQVSESLANKADKESYVQIKVTGTAIAHYAKAADIPLSTAASGYYLCDLAIGGVTKRVIAIVAANSIVNEISPANGDTYICTSEGKLYAATANNTTAWTECGAIGVQGEQGYGVVATVSQPSLTEAQWTLYGTLNRNEEWSGTSGTRNGCRIGDLFTVSGTSTDGGRAHFLLFRSTTATGNLIGTCIGHTTAERGKAATVKVGNVTTGEAGSDATVTNSGTDEDAVLDFKIPKGKQGESAVNIVQETGVSETDVMSQYAVTQELFNQKYSFLVNNCEYVKDAHMTDNAYQPSIRSGAITAAKYPTINEIILDITVRAVAAEGIYSICGGRAGTANIVNMLLVKNGKLAYCNDYNVSANTVETDYEFDDNYHHIVSKWGATWQKIYVDGNLIVDVSGLASRNMYVSGYYGIYWLCYNDNGSRRWAVPDGFSVKGVARMYINGGLANMFFGSYASEPMRPYLWSSLSTDYSFDLDGYDNDEMMNLKGGLRNAPRVFSQKMQNFCVTLTEEQAERINRNPVVTVVFKCVHNDTRPRYCGVDVPPTSVFTTSQVIDGLTYWNGINFVRCYNQYGYHFQSLSASQPVGGLDACVNLDRDYYGCLMFVLNRVEGRAYIYNETGELLGSRHHASLKYDKFISDSRVLEIKGEPCKYVCEVAIYDGDISQFRELNMFKNPLLYKKDVWGTYNNSPSVECLYDNEKWVLNEDDGLYHITKDSAMTLRFETFGYYTNYYAWTTWKKLKINSGTFKFRKNPMYPAGYGSLHVYNADGDEVTDETLSEGVYTVYSTVLKQGGVGGACSDNFDMNFVEGESSKVSCCFRLDNFANREHLIYEAASESLMTLFLRNGNTLTKRDLLTQEYDLHSVDMLGYAEPLACYIGRMRYNDAGNLQMVAKDYTWKQINNV